MVSHFTFDHTSQLAHGAQAYRHADGIHLQVSFRSRDRLEAIVYLGNDCPGDMLGALCLDHSVGHEKGTPIRATLAA